MPPDNLRGSTAPHSDDSRAAEAQAQHVRAPARAARRVPICDARATTGQRR